MKPSYNLLPGRMAALLCLVTLLSAASGLAIGSKEQRTFDAAQEAMRDGFWDRAETGFADFAAKYPKSELHAQAILLQAQARYKQTNSLGTVELLKANLPESGFLADEYYFWIAEAQFQALDFAEAAGSYAKLERDFPLSDRRLEASLGEASSRAQLGQWQEIVGVLSQPYGVFAQAAKNMPTDESVLRGWLLLSEAYFNEGDATNAESTLAPLTGQHLDGALDWRRCFLQCRILVLQHRDDEALQTSTNLELIAGTLSPDAKEELTAEAALFRARILERLGRLDEAIAALEPNLALGVPAGPQRQSLLKIAQLSLAEGKSADARQTLEKFLAEYPGAPAVDTALVALGELELRDAVSGAVLNSAGGVFDRTNRLPQVVARFDAVLQNHPGSPATGKALLDKGWALWLGGDTTNSGALFKAATESLPSSEDQVIARFKWADTQLETGDYAGALANYDQVIRDSANLPEMKGQSYELALYQTVRAGLKAGNLDAATEALRKIFELYPNGLLGDHSLLLVGQGMMQQRDPAGARALFEEFARQRPGTLSPEINLAIARTYELEGDWNAAVGHYTTWLASYSNSVDQAQAQYYRAWATFQTGDETNALIQFTNFVAQFPINALAPMAQWWVADHYYRQGDFLGAEKSYKSLFQTWPDSELSMEAHLMAGRAAAGCLNFAGAIEYFTNLTSRVDCPQKLKTQALFAYGDALVQLGGTDTNRFANLDLARQVYSQICQVDPTNDQALLAWGQIGNCYLQLGAQNPNYYTNALDAYVRVMTSPFAGIGARSQAQFGVGQVLEKEAQTKSGDEQTAWLKQALNNYLDVVYGINLRDGETRDLYWTKKAGIEAARLAESLQEWSQAIKLYHRLENLMPQLQGSFDKKIARAQEAFVHGGN